MSYVRCQRCNRPACPDCQRPAAVGIHCVDCVREAAKAARPTRAVFGGRADGTPVVTYAIIAICVVVWLGELIRPSLASAVMFTPDLGLVEPWRFLTAAFAHDRGFVFHILFNMYLLYILGGYLEPLMGRARFTATYLISAIGGQVMFLLLAAPPSQDPGLWSSSWYTGVVGASGAVFGLFGAYVVLNRRLGRSSAGIYATLALNAVLGFVIQGIAWQAHLGGFLVGAACAVVIAYAGRPPKAVLQWAGLAAVLAVCVVLAMLKYASV